MRRRVASWRAARRPQPRPPVARAAGAPTVRGPSLRRGSSPSSASLSRPEPRRLSGHLRHTILPGPPWRSAPICQIHGPAPRTRTRTHNNHAIRPRVVSSSDRQMGDTEPNNQMDGSGAIIAHS